VICVRGSASADDLTKCEQNLVKALAFNKGQAPMASEDPNHPYSPAFRVDDLAFVSGALPMTNSGLVGGRATALDAALETLAARLATVNMTLADVIKLTYFVTDITLRDEANKQLIERFSHPRPARTFVEVTRLPYGANVEIDAVAHRAATRVR
jgi:enamine deaminase RidA (YjgF/YER057c/UK114 family)